MNLKLFSLISSDDIPATKLQIKISGSLNAFTDDDVSSRDFLLSRRCSRRSAKLSRTPSL